MSSLPTGTIGISSGPVMAAMHVFKLTISGKGGYTGFPQDSIDPVLTSASIIQAVQTLENGIFKPTLIIFGKIMGGTVYNAIADKVEMEGTIRYLYDFQSDPSLSPVEKFERHIKSICDAYRAKYKLDFLYSHPAVINDGDMVERSSEQPKKRLNRKISFRSSQ